VGTLMFGAVGPTAAADAPNTCAQATTTSPIGSWISGTIESSTDVDWYAFPVPKDTYLQFTLGSLPENYRMDVYYYCGGDQLFRSYEGGTAFEEVILHSAFHPWTPSHVRISSSGASSNLPYKLRVRVVPRGLSILSHDSFADEAGQHIVGEVFTTSSHRRIRVTATLYDSSDAVIGTVSRRTMLSVIQRGRAYDRPRTPFRITFVPPVGFDHYRLAVTGISDRPNPLDRWAVTPLPPFVDGLGVAHFSGETANQNGITVASLDVFVTVYDKLGRVINTAVAVTNKETLANYGKATFDATFDSHFAAWNKWRADPQAIPAP
jgi:hypothetical protein